MIIGQTHASTATVNSPGVERLGDTATFYLDIIAAYAGVKLDVDIQHKKRTEADSAATTIESFAQITATGPASKAASNLKELVRFKFIVTDGGTKRWVHFQVMPPIWVTN
jgi:hypothetical protein